MNLRTNCFSLVIEAYDVINNILIDDKKIQDYCENNECIRFYALILHDKDVTENGEKIRNHYHLVIYLKSQFTKSSVLNDITNYLKCNRNIVSVRVGDLIESTIYLTHQEYSDSRKHVYSTLDIKTNDISNLNNILSKQVSNYVITIDYLISLVEKCKTISEVYSVLGLKESKLYRSLIVDLWKEKSQFKL